MLLAPLVLTLLPFTQLKLDNGLTVFVQEDHTVPVVAIEVWYRVGSRDEAPGKTGFAHLFEHMMFQGSAHVGDKMHLAYVQQAGGRVNGTTNTDRTDYFETLPSNFLELGLWLESDRMGYLLPALTGAKLDNQRDVVKNEKRQSYDNAPYGGVRKAVMENLYPPEHPYHHLTIGEHEDLTRATLDDVKAFFTKWYAPANATLAIVGDVDVPTAKRLCEKYFAALPSPPKAPARARSFAAPRLAGERRVTLEDRVALERVYLVWPSPALYATGDAELDLLAMALGGKSGRLYKRLVYDARAAQTVEVSQESAPLSSMFEIVVTLKPGHHASEIVPIVDEELTRAKKELVSARELEKAKMQYELSFVDALSAASGRATALNRYADYAGDAAFIDKDLLRYRNADAAAVQRWARATLGPGRLVLTVTPVTAKKEAR